MKSRHARHLTLAAGMAIAVGQASAQSFTNGNFETGDLSGWTVVNTTNGTGAPGNAVNIDIDGPGPLGSTFAAHYLVGQAVSQVGVQAGIEMTQNLTLTGGVQYTFDFDWSAQNSSATNNAEGGVFSLIVNGAVITSVAAGTTSSATPHYGHIHATYTPPSGGVYSAGIRITRPFTVGGTVSEYVDNVILTVPFNPTDPGACCQNDGTCADGTFASCNASGGVFQGLNSVCSGVTCPAPVACCRNDGSCSNVPPAICAGGGGTAQGAGSTCATFNCNGACCRSDGTCASMSQASCSALGTGNVFQGFGSTCGAVTCPQPGACCSFQGTCTTVLQTACTGTFQSGTCATVTCPGIPPVVYSNCNLPTGATTLSGVAAPAGSLWSECADADPPNQAVVQNTTAGFSVSGAFRLADDLVVPAGGLNVAYVKIPVYTTGATTVTTTAATLEIRDAAPPGGNVVFGNTTTNRLANAEFSNIYRIFNTHNGPACGGTGTAPGTTRRIQWAYIAVNQFLPAGTYWLSWNVTGGTFAPSSTEADAIGRSCGNVVGNGLQLNGTWVAALDAGQGCTPSNVQMDHYFEVLGTPGTTGCYANCDGSTTPPVANVADFTCFLQKFAANDPYANCDGSTTPPTINVADFTCFLQKFAAGCP